MQIAVSANVRMNDLLKATECTRIIQVRVGKQTMNYRRHRWMIRPPVYLETRVLCFAHCRRVKPAVRSTFGLFCEKLTFSPWTYSPPDVQFPVTYCPCNCSDIFCRTSKITTFSKQQSFPAVRHLPPFASYSAFCWHCASVNFTYLLTYWRYPITNKPS